MKKPSDPTIAEKFNTYRPAYRRQVRGLQGEGDRLVEEGDDGERGVPGLRIGMDVVEDMKKAECCGMAAPDLGTRTTFVPITLME